MSDPRHIIKFTAANGFTVVLEYGSAEELEVTKQKIEEAGLTVEQLDNFNFNFNTSDLFMDMRSPECVAQFDLEDWI